MDYEGRICRTPMERGSFMLPVQVGCSYNKCKFCTLFKHLNFRIIPMKTIEEELARVQSLNGSPSKVFLGDGNAFSLGFNKLSKIIDLIHRYFPDCNSINMDATITSIAALTDDQLAALSQSGVRCLYIGIESGLDDVLTFMSKDHNLAIAETQIKRIHAAGMQFGAHIMTGIAGEGRGIENAEATAAFLNKTKPVSITNFSMFTEKRAPLWACVEDGTYKPASVQESMKEEFRLLELLDIECQYDGFQDFIKHRTRGTLPIDKEKMLTILQKKIYEYQNKEPIYPCVDVEPGECACQYTADSVCSNELSNNNFVFSQEELTPTIEDMAVTVKEDQRYEADFADFMVRLKDQYEAFKQEINGVSKFYTAVTDKVDEFISYENEGIPHSDEYYDSLILSKRAAEAFIDHLTQKKETETKIKKTKELLELLNSIPDNETDETRKVSMQLQCIAAEQARKSIEAKQAEDERLREEARLAEEKNSNEFAYLDQLKNDLSNFITKVDECNPRRVVCSDEYRSTKNVLADTVKFLKKIKRDTFTQKAMAQVRDALQSIADFAEIYLAKKTAEPDDRPLTADRVSVITDLHSFSVTKIKEMNKKLGQSDITCIAAAKVLRKKAQPLISEDPGNAVFDTNKMQNYIAAIIYAKELEQMPITKLYNKEMAVKALASIAQSDTVKELSKTRINFEEIEQYID